MAKTQDGGKVPRTPTLSYYDNRRPKAETEPAVGPTLVPVTSGGYDQSLVKDAPRTHSRDKALLVALGVDGDVPLAQARVNMVMAKFNSGKMSVNEVRAWAGLPALPANDNELAAKAA